MSVAHAMFVAVDVVLSLLLAAVASPDTAANTSSYPPAGAHSNRSVFGSNQNWRRLGQRWAREAQLEVHLLSARNHGKSARAPTMSYAEMVSDTRNYLTEVASKSPGNLETTVLGHSMGGKVRFVCVVFFVEMECKVFIKRKSYFLFIYDFF